MRRLALAVVFLASLACAQEVGNVANLVPAASITREKKTAEAKVADAVWLNDVLRTNKAGRMRLKLADGSLLSVGSAAELRVAKHDPNAQQSEIELLYGAMRGEVQSVTKKGGYFTIKTPTAAIGVIGTTVGAEVVQMESSRTVAEMTEEQLNSLPTNSKDFLSLVQLQPGDPNAPFHDISQYLTDGTVVWSEDHLVYVRNIDPQVQGLVVLQPWEYTLVKRGQPPTPPRRLGPGKGSSPDKANEFDIGGPFVKEHLWVWGSYGCQAVNLVNKKPIPNPDWKPNVLPELAKDWNEYIDKMMKLEIHGGGTSTGNVFHVHLENKGDKCIYGVVPAGSILHPTGFWERKLIGTFLGGNPDVKNFQIMMTEGGGYLILPAVQFQNAHGVSPLGGGEVPPGGSLDFELRGFCLELHKLAPHPSTKYEFSGEDEVEHFDPNRRLLGKVYQMYFEHQLDPQYTRDGIAQWTLWASREGMDEKKFREAYLDLSHKNYEARKEKWNKEAEQKARAFADAFWVQVNKILTAYKADEAANKP